MNSYSDTTCAAVLPAQVPDTAGADEVPSNFSLKILGLMVLGYLGLMSYFYAMGYFTPDHKYVMTFFMFSSMLLLMATLSLGSIAVPAIRTLNLSGFNAFIIFGAITFSAVYSGLGASAMIRDTITGLDVNPWVILILMQLSFFLLGMFLDDIAILFLCMPIYVPIIKALGFDPVWFAILYVVNMQMAYITPPYGLNLFYMKAVAPKEISLGDIYRSIVPFLGLQFIGLVILVIFPEITLWLPGLLFDYLQMKMNPDMLFGRLDVILEYPSLIKVLMANPDQLFDSGNFVNLFAKAPVVDLLSASKEFASYLFGSPGFVDMLHTDGWLLQIPEIANFVSDAPAFLQQNPDIMEMLLK